MFDVLLSVATTSSDEKVREHAWGVVFALLQSTWVQRRVWDIFPGFPDAVAGFLAREHLTKNERDAALIAVASLCEFNALAVFQTPGLMRRVVTSLKTASAPLANNVFIALAQHAETKRCFIRDEELVQSCMRVVAESNDARTKANAILALSFVVTNDEGNGRIVCGDAELLTRVLDAVRANDVNSECSVCLLLQLSLSPPIAHMLDRRDVLDALCSAAHSTTENMNTLVLASIVDMDPKRLEALGVSGRSLARSILWYAVESFVHPVLVERFDSALVLLSRMCDATELQPFLVGCLFHDAIARGLARELAKGDGETVALAVSTWRKFLKLPGLRALSRLGVNDVLVGLMVVVATSGADAGVRAEAREVLELMLA